MLILYANIISIMQYINMKNKSKCKQFIIFKIKIKLYT